MDHQKGFTRPVDFFHKRKENMKKSLTAWWPRNASPPIHSLGQGKDLFVWRTLAKEWSGWWWLRQALGFPFSFLMKSLTVNPHHHVPTLMLQQLFSFIILSSVATLTLDRWLGMINAFYCPSLFLGQRTSTPRKRDRQKKSVPLLPPAWAFSCISFSFILGSGKRRWKGWCSPLQAVSIHHCQGKGMSAWWWMKLVPVT